MKKTVVGELVGAPEERRRAGERIERIERATRDFSFFCSYYLPDYFFTGAAEYQTVLNDVADTRSLTPATIERLQEFVSQKYRMYLKPTDNLAGAIFAEPREHGKTVRWSFAYPLWRILSGKSQYILLIGATGEAASSNLINIRIELEENERLLEDFGEQKGERWSDSRIELANGTCIQAKGAGMSMRGTRFRQYRPDLIVLDDLLKDDAVESPTTRSKIHRWLKRVVFNLGKSAFIVWVNTIFHSDDPLSRLLDELKEGTLKRWVAVRLSCYKPDGTPLWPAMWSKETLEEKKSQLGSDIFSCEWENEPISEEQRVIHREWIELHWYAPAEAPALETLRRFAWVDPGDVHDQTAIVSIGVDKQGIIWSLDSWGRTCSETETVIQLIEKHRVFRYELIGWEKVTFQAIYARYVVKLAAEKGVHLPIRTFAVGSESKISRVRAISPLIENGVLRLRQKGDEALIEQLVNLLKTKFDDEADALAGVVSVAQRGPGAPMVVPFIRAGQTISRILKGYRT